jgi:CelD/BcsL family acetyltransferase involved in cellulose biosynthesis
MSRSTLAKRRSAPEVLSMDSVGDLAALRAEWNDLAARAPGTSYFQTGDWVVAWWVSVAGRAPTRIARWRDDDGQLRAVAAVSRGHEVVHHRFGLQVPVLRIAGSGPGAGDHCGVVAPPELHDDVAGWLGSVAHRGPLVMSGAAANAAVAARVPGARQIGSVTCPRLDLDGLGPGPAARSANFRSQLGRYARRLARAGVELAWHAPGELDGSTLDAAYRLHQELRRSRGLRTSLTDAHRRLLLRCAGYGTRDRGVAAMVARRDARVVGAIVGFWLDGCFAAYQSGWDAAYAGDSIGSVLVSHAIEHARAAGAHTFDFLRGNESYKYRFGARDVFDDTYLIPHGWAGRVLMLRAALRRQASSRPTEEANRSPSFADST